MTEVLPVRAEVSPEWRPPWARVMPDAVALADAVADTEFVPRGLRGKPPAILAAIMYGHEIGLPPMQSLARIAVIDGKPNVSAETFRGLILADGHEIWIVEATTTRVTMAGRRRGSSQSSEVTWTADDAKRAGLAGKPNWRAYPRQMLTARATAELARILFADVVGGMIATEELDDDAATFADGDQPDGKAPTRSRTRRPRAAGKDATNQPSETPPGPETSGDPPGPFVEPGPDDPELPLPDEAGPPSTTPADLEAEAQADASDAIHAEAAAKRERNNVAMAEAIAQSAEPQLMTDLQRMKMQAMFRERNVTTREARLSYVATVTGRQVETSNLLTIDEAGRVIDALEQWNPEDPNSLPFPPGSTPPAPPKYDPATAPFPEGY